MAWGKPQAIASAPKTNTDVTAGKACFTTLIEELQFCCTPYLTPVLLQKFLTLRVGKTKKVLLLEISKLF